tara:strand:- start:74 stop:1225 length:1152 start_codon:yes stop_codon:yes gene_type:complete
MSKSSESLLNTQKGFLDGKMPTNQGENSKPTDNNPGSATQQELMAAERLLGVKIIRQQNPEGRITFILATDNGQKLDFDEKGNVFLGAAKVGDDETGGNVTLRSWGDLTLKVGGKLNLEVENFIDEEKPISIKVGGDCNIEAVDGHLALKGKNVSVRADADLNLFGNNIKMQAGDNGAGALSVTAGTISTESSFIENVTSGWFQKVKGEYTIRQVEDPRASFNINTLGHLKIQSIGDCKVSHGGRFQHLIGGIVPKPPTVTSKDAYSVFVSKGDTSFTSTAGNHTELFTAGNVTKTMSAGNLTQTVTGNVTRASTKDITETATKNYTLAYLDGKTTVGKSQVNTVTENLTQTTGGNLSHIITGMATIRASGNMTIGGAMIFLN